jgi:hypothetical protein
MPSMLIKINMAAFKNAVQLSSIVIPDNVTIIATDAFADCSGLQTVSMPERLEVVANSAFEGTAMQSVTLGDRVDFNQFSRLCRLREPSRCLSPIT